MKKKLTREFFTDDLLLSKFFFGNIVLWFGLVSGNSIDLLKLDVHMLLN